MPRKLVSEKVVDQVNTLVGAYELARKMIPAIFEDSHGRILLCLVSAFVNNEALAYTRISELTQLKAGDSLNYPLRSLRRLGLVYTNGNGNYRLTDAGLITATYLVRYLNLLLRETKGEKLGGDLKVLPNLSKYREVLQQLSAALLEEKKVAFVFPTLLQL